jgi:rhodanese-related sulfurtransferase
MIPQPLGDGFFKVDSTWGTVQPLQLAEGVRTIAEQELVEHLHNGGAIIDTRLCHFYEEATIPGARAIPHEEIVDHIGDLDRDSPTVFFCNGPQCAATPDAIRLLLEAGHPPAAILYYRGGIHDWMTLGYPTVPGT